jgi:hypothetical protein
MKTDREYLKNDIEHSGSAIEYYEQEADRAVRAHIKAVVKSTLFNSRRTESEEKLKELNFLIYCRTGRFPE